jgi:hypothetical protein
MKKLLLATVLVMSVMLIGSVAFGSPTLLPKHPGYPMGAFKDPVSGMPTANDPGQQAPSPDEALKAAAAFDDPRVVNTVKEIRPSIVHDFMEKEVVPAPEADNS